MKKSEQLAIKRILYVVVFLVLFVFILTRITYVIRTNGDTKNRFAGFYAQKRNSIDVMIFGSSAASTSFAPGRMYGEYGFSSYPLSSNSQGPEAIQCLLKECYKTQSPRVVVIEVRMFMNDPEKVDADEGHIREVTDNMKYSINRIKTINKLEKNKDKRISYYLDIMKYHSNWGLVLIGPEWKNINYRYDYIEKGFEYITEVEGQRRYVPDAAVVPERITVKYENELKELMSFFREHDQEAVFVSTPVAMEDEYIYKLKYISELVSEEKFEFLEMNDFYDEIGIDFSTDFKEGAHLNIYGAAKVSDYLGKYLVDRYDLPDHRGDKKYNSFEKAYEFFEKQMKTS